MMTETVPSIRLDSLHEKGRIGLKAVGEENELQILDTQTGKVLGCVLKSVNTPFDLELFWGKGGFMATVLSPEGILYFALPGSQVELPGLKLELEGDIITPNPRKTPAPPVRQVQQHSIQATILGAGLATRFERISGNSTHCSKPGVPLVGSQTVIECIANHLAWHGFKRIIVNTFFKPESVKTSLARSKAETVLYLDEKEPSGTAGGLRKMLTLPEYVDFLDLTKPLLVVQGDAVTDADFSLLMEAHIREKALLTLGCQPVAEEDVDKFGIIVTDASGADGQSGNITEFQEKPSRAEAKSFLGNTGFYIFSPQAYPLIQTIYEELLANAREKARLEGKPAPDEVSFDFAMDIFPRVLAYVKKHPEAGKMWAQMVPGYWSDIGNPRQYIESIHDIYAGKVNIPLPEQLERFYRDGVIYWEGTQEIVEREKAILKGNVVVAKPYSAP